MKKTEAEQRVLEVNKSILEKKMELVKTARKASRQGNDMLALVLMTQSAVMELLHDGVFREFFESKKRAEYRLLDKFSVDEIFREEFDAIKEGTEEALSKLENDRNRTKRLQSVLPEVGDMLSEFLSRE